MSATQKKFDIVSGKFQVKSQLAKLLAIENISIRHDPTLTTAGFDVKNRVLYLPNWTDISNELYDMLVVHEVGHALNTPSQEWENAIDKIASKNHKKASTQVKMAIKGFLNVVEDARIDKLQKRRYPGSKQDYVVGYRELFDRDFFGIKDKNVNEMSFIDRANLYFKVGSHTIINFTPDELDFIRRMEKLETFDEVVDITDEIYAACKDAMTTSSNKIILIEDENGEEYEVSEDGQEAYVLSEDGDEEIEIEIDADGNSSESDKSDSENEGEGEDSDADGSEDASDAEGKDGDKGDKSDSKGESESKDAGDDASKGQKSKASKGAGGNNSADEIIPESATDKATQEGAKSIVNVTNDWLEHVLIPEFDRKVIQDYKVVLPRLRKQSLDSKAYGYSGSFEGSIGRTYRVNTLDKELQEWKMNETRTISFMVKEFEMRKAADTYSKISVARTGVIDTNRLHSYKYNDDIFRRAKSIPKGKNHGFVLILDWSGSMQSDIKSTLKQLYSLVLFCKRVQIPFEVFYFRTMSSNCADDFPIEKVASQGKDYIQFGAFALCNFLSSRMNANELQEAMRLMYYASEMHYKSDTMSGTPLNQAILCCEQIVKEFQTRTKVQIVSTIILSDGESDSCYGSRNSPRWDSIHKRYVYSKMVLEDPKTKKQYHAGNYGNYTKIFLEVLKERTNCHLIGFFLTSSLKYIGSIVLAGADEKMQKEFKENNYVGIKNEGYDEYFIVNISALQREAQKEFVVSPNASMKKVSSQFKKFTGEKKINRQMLTNFIKHIASDVKKK